MSKSELEMEDPEKLPDNSENIVQESQSKVVGDNVESKAEESLCAAATSEDVIEKENGGENLNECRKDEKNDTKDITEAEEGQTYHTNEDNEEVIVHEKISAKNGIEDLINTKGNADEDPPGPISAVEKQTDADNVVVDQKAANGGMKKEYFTEDGNHMEYVKENTSEDVTVENPEIIVQSNPDDGEHMVLGGKTREDADVESRQLPTNEDPQREKVDLDVVRQSEDVEIKTADNLDKNEPDKDYPIEQGAETVLHHETDGNNRAVVVASKRDGEDTIIANQHEAVTPDVLVKCSTLKAGDHSGETFKTASTLATLPPIGEGDDGTLEDQIAFMKELDSFHQEKALEFKPPKFYGQPLNCLKLWRAVIRLGGYDTVTGAKLWRQVGESFHPPKTCTTVSWTFRIFYEKSLLEYERHKTRIGELQLPVPTPPEASSIDGVGEGSSYQGSGSGRARRDSASRAMQGWHVQRLSGQGEIGEPIMKDKNLGNMAKREKNLKSISSLKQKRPNEVEHSNKVARTEIFKQLATSVVDVGPPADWVKISVRQTKECFEIYALVPGLLREEVRVQSDPAGRVVITGQPEQGDNPWGITPFKKVISLPTRIDPLETSAVVSLHGRLFVRVPFEQSK